MPDWIIGVGFLVVLVGGVYLWQKGMAAVSKKANQAVFDRRGHREGQELVMQRMDFTARASPDEVKQAVLAKVAFAPGVPAIIQDAHVIEATDDHILFGFGNKLNPHNFRGILGFDRTASGVRGSWEIVNWTMADGIVVGQPVMKRLAHDIDLAIRSVDPDARLRVATTR